MADTTVTIASSGADYTTITNALAASNVSSGAWIMQITDTRNYGDTAADDIIDFQATTGTPTQANRLILEADANNRHSGVLEDPDVNNYAKLVSQANSSFAYNFYEDYTEIRHMFIGSRTSESVTNIRATGLLFSRCLFRSVGASSLDPIFNISAGNVTDASIYIDNCVFGQAGRIISYAAGVNSSLDFYMDHCAIDIGTFADVVYLNGGFASGVTVRFFFNNNWINADGNEYDDVRNLGASSSATYNGAYNVGDNQTPFDDVDATNNTTNYVYASGGLTTNTITSDAIIITSTTADDLDATPKLATQGGSNEILGYAGNRIGSEPDSRQDFSTDIIGNSRPTRSGYIDVGPFQITEAPPGFKYWNGTTWADSVSVQYYNGTAWADVVAVKYWDGTQWADPV